METKQHEDPNSHLASIHANDNKNVVKEQSESAEQKRLDETRVPAGDNSHLANRIAGKVDENGESIETINVDELPTHVGGIKLEHEFDNAPESANTESAEAPVTEE